MKILNIHITVIISFILCCLVLTAQDTPEGESSIIRTKDGVMIIYNANEIIDTAQTNKNIPVKSHVPANFVIYNPITSFRFDIKCKSFNEVESNNLMFLVDDMVFQFIPVPISSISKADISKDKNDSLILLYHQLNELKTIRETLPGDFEINDEMFTTSTGRICLFWEFDMPRTDKDTAENSIYKQMYLTTRINEKVLMFSSAVQKKNNPKEVRNFLKQTISTIRTTEGIYNVQELSDSLNNVEK